VPTTAADAGLKWLLRLSGGVELLAIPFVVFPLSGMTAIHDRLGLGPLPSGPVVEYMARTLSAVYAVHGAVLVALSIDVPRYRPVIRMVGCLHAVAGLVFLGIDLSAGMPWFWTAGEGPPVTAIGALIAWLSWKGKTSDPAQFPSTSPSPGDRSPTPTGRPR
jgi:hypothetical protein